MLAWKSQALPLSPSHRTALCPPSALALSRPSFLDLPSSLVNNDLAVRFKPNSSHSFSVTGAHLTKSLPLEGKVPTKEAEEVLVRASFGNDASFFSSRTPRKEPAGDSFPSRGSLLETLPSPGQYAYTPPNHSLFQKKR